MKKEGGARVGEEVVRHWEEEQGDEGRRRGSKDHSELTLKLRGSWRFCGREDDFRRCRILSMALDSRRNSSRR